MPSRTGPNARQGEQRWEKTRRDQDEGEPCFGGMSPDWTPQAVSGRSLPRISRAGDARCCGAPDVDDEQGDGESCGTAKAARGVKVGRGA